ncbi:MAG: hypothetical protein J3K34DRAFT_523549 [Monoraphidium minutum]|nr:MAG: hypothetical protein J3K34DRAFT_523549 [Monoraphidium minutum]
MGASTNSVVVTASGTASLNGSMRLRRPPSRASEGGLQQSLAPPLRWAATAVARARARAPPRRTLGRWTLAAAALAATALLVLALRDACESAAAAVPVPGHCPRGSGRLCGGGYFDPISGLPMSFDVAVAANRSGTPPVVAAAAAAAAAAARNAREWAGGASGLARPPTLHFEVCNGFANQRLSIMYGLVIAKALGRAAVLPALLLDGTQMTAAAASLAAAAAAGGGGIAAFEDFYDLDEFGHAMGEEGVPVLTRSEFDAAFGPAVDVAPLIIPGALAAGNLGWLRNASQGRPHVSVGCPLFALPADAVLAEEGLARRSMAALRPAAGVEARVQEYLAHIGSARFNYLHLRLEEDWQRHCDRWSTYTREVDGIIRDNCFNNTLQVHTALQARNFDKALPLYVAAHWPGVPPALANDVLGRIRRAGFTVVRSPPPAGGRAALPREAAALVEWELALRSERFLGNSVSTFSALLILERRASGAWAGYYNGGGLPLAEFVPLFATPWVFTFNSWSAPYEGMLKAAVNSAAAHGHLSAHCIFGGDMKAPVVRWMRAKGVRVIHHDPAWKDELAAMADRIHMGESHLFRRGPRGRALLLLLLLLLHASAKSVVGTWQRIDMPIIPWLDQFTYVLFTDTDVFFRRRFASTEIPSPLPRSVGMGPEKVNTFPYNAGVMVANMASLAATYEAFLEFILASESGLVFAGYGPGDQGAYNMFYEPEVREWRLPIKFNAKPYHRAAPRALEDVAIVHFHGPKPSHYMHYATTNVCYTFSDLCREGIEARACIYVGEWLHYAEPGPETEGLRRQWEAGCRGRVEAYQLMGQLPGGYLTPMPRPAPAAGAGGGGGGGGDDDGDSL